MDTGFNVEIKTEGIYHKGVIIDAYDLKILETICKRLIRKARKIVKKNDDFTNAVQVSDTTMLNIAKKVDHQKNKKNERR